MQTHIRSYQSSDLDALYQICLQTAHSGKDGTHLFDDPQLVGNLSAAPYVLFEPELCFVVCCDGIPCGYILGTKDSEVFYQRCNKEWFPKLQKKYLLPSEGESSHQARIIRLIHNGQNLKEELRDYPAHLHIDLLPQTQGQGVGRKLMAVFIDKLKNLKVPAVHLEVGKANTGAIRFYEKVGFHIIKEYEHSIAFGKTLEKPR